MPLLQTEAARKVLLNFHEVVVAPFPFVLNELDGIQAAMLSEDEAASAD